MMPGCPLLLFLLLFMGQQVASGGECGHPGSPANGTLLSSEVMFYPGEEVSYSCTQGLLLSSSQGGGVTRRCGQDGRWTGDMPHCLENLALDKPATQSDVLWSYRPELAVDGDPNTCSFTTRKEGQRWWQVSLSSHPTVSSVWVTMSPGAFQKFAIFVVQIRDGNTAEYKPCAQFEGRFTDQLAKFECNGGLGQLGQFVYIRDDRVDSEYFGLCEVQVFQRREVASCGVPESPVYSRVEVEGGRATYHCVQGFSLRSGDRVRNCSHQGWLGATPSCQEVKCDHPSSTKDGFIEVSNFRGSYVFGSRAAYHCNPGFILWGNSSRLCDSEGSWTGSPPTCRPISCGDPPLLPHSSIALLNGSTQWRSVVVYSCLPGYQPHSGNEEGMESLCLESGSWSKVHLSCLAPGQTALLGRDTNVFLVEDSPTARLDAPLDSGTVTVVCVLGAVILGTAGLTAFILVRKWVFQHLYYPPPPAGEKPLIYDKVERVERRAEASGSPYKTTQLTTTSPFKTTQLTTFQLPTSSSPSLSSSPSSAFSHYTSSTCAYASSAPLVSLPCSYSNSLPRPDRPMAWAYAAPTEVAVGHSGLLPPPSHPEYANLPLHYATLGRRGVSRPRPIGGEKILQTESIPDILQTLTARHSPRVIVNALEGIEDTISTQPKLIDLSPECPGEEGPHKQSYISVKHLNIDENI